MPEHCIILYCWRDVRVGGIFRQALQTINVVKVYISIVLLIRYIPWRGVRNRGEFILGDILKFAYFRARYFDGTCCYKQPGCSDGLWHVTNSTFYEAELRAQKK